MPDERIPCRPVVGERTVVDRQGGEGKGTNYTPKKTWNRLGRIPIQMNVRKSQVADALTS